MFQSIFEVFFFFGVERLSKQCWRHFGSGLKDDENSKDFYLPLGLIWRDEVKGDQAEGSQIKASLFRLFFL